MDETFAIIELLKDSLGQPKKMYEGKTQIQFNCPICDEGENKGNLEVNVNKSLFHCWSCGDINETHGSLTKLFDLFGTKKQKKLYKLLRPEEVPYEVKKTNKITLPEGFIRFVDSNPRIPEHQQALNYLYQRSITDEMITKYDIGYTVKGNCKSRIIIPSYDSEGNLNYYVARSWGRTKIKYMNPDAQKSFVIFNESRINWNNDIYLCEGVFDSLFLNNSIALLGKDLSETLFEKIYTNAKKYIHICLDGDAYKNAINLYHTLNGGNLYGRIKLYKLPKDKDVCDLKGDIKNYEIKIK